MNPVTWYERWESRLGKVGMALVWALAMQCVSFCFYSYHFWMPPSYRFSETYLRLAHDPWTDIAWNPEMKWEPWIRHRLLGPMIAYLLHLPDLATAFVPVFGVTLMLFFSHLLLRRHCELVVTMQGVTLLSTTLSVITGHTHIGFQDPLAAAALVGMMLVRSPVLSSIILAIGMLADERCAAALPLVLLWHHWQGDEQGSSNVWKSTIMRGLLWSMVVAVWAFYFWWMMTTIILPGMQLSFPEFRKYIYHEGLYARQVNTFAAAGFFTLRGAWLIPILLVKTWWKPFKYRTFMFILATAVTLVQGFLVADMSRAMSIDFVGLMLSILLLSNEGASQLSPWLNAAIWLNFCVPAYQIIGKDLSWIWPLPLSLCRAILT